MKEIPFTRPMLERFKKALEGKDKEDVIVFEGHEFLVSYARYLVEYLEGELR
jgi:hypothetical protein